MSDKASGKDVIYIDVDDEITSVIDKVRGSHTKIVALVLPKRATVLQSIVNMKLLKRAADESKKNLVLITSEAGLLPLAGNVGLYVAKTLQSKPEIPEAPEGGDGAPEDVMEDDGPEESVAAVTAAGAAAGGARSARAAADSPLDRNRSVGELAGTAAMDDTIELDDDMDDRRQSGAAMGGVSEPGKPKDKKLTIPNFNKFRLILVLAGVGVVLLGVLAYVAFAIMPKATISIETDSQAVTSSTIVTLKTGDTTLLNVEEGIVPAKSQQVQKTVTEQVAASGQQNNGAKATGTITIINCSDSIATVSAGSGFTVNGLTYISQQAASIPPSNFTSPASGSKCKNDGKDTVDVEAQSAGAKYNAAAASYTIAGKPADLSATGSAMDGGTDDIVKIVTQGDVDSATQKITSQDSTASKTQLKTDLTNAGYLPVEATFTTGQPQTKTSANVGDKADNVSVTQTLTYTMLGAKQDDLKKIIADDVNGTIDTKKQKILDYGLDGLVFGVQSQPADGAVLTMQTTAVAGPELDAESLKKQVAGKKANAARDLIKQNPGVTDVTVKYSPFWVSAVPSKTSKITVTIEKPQKTVKSNSSSNAESNP
jgi:hypothetical protein